MTGRALYSRVNNGTINNSQLKEKAIFMIFPKQANCTFQGAHVTQVRSVPLPKTNWASSSTTGNIPPPPPHTPVYLTGGICRCGDYPPSPHPTTLTTLSPLFPTTAPTTLLLHTAQTSTLLLRTTSPTPAPFYSTTTPITTPASRQQLLSFPLTH